MSGLVFVGAFNPPTLAHTHLAELAMRATGSDYVTFVPSKQTYIRDLQKKDYAFTDDERLMMLRTLAEARNWMRVSPYELDSPYQPRTYETLHVLQQEGIGGALLIGTDKLEELDTNWYYVREILTEFGIVCLERENDHAEQIISGSPQLSALRSHIRIIPSDDRYKYVSSTGVRQSLSIIAQQMHRLQSMLDPELYDLYATGKLLPDISPDEKGAHEFC